MVKLFHVFILVVILTHSSTDDSPQKNITAGLDNRAARKNNNRYLEIENIDSLGERFQIKNVLKILCKLKLNLLNLINAFIKLGLVRVKILSPIICPIMLLQVLQHPLEFVMTAFLSITFRQMGQAIICAIFLPALLRVFFNFEKKNIMYFQNGD